MRSLTRRASVMVTLAISAMALPTAARAADVTWVSSTDGLWLNPSNWDLNVPTFEDTAILPSSLVAQGSVLNIDLEDGLIEVDRLRFDLDFSFGSYNLINGAISARDVFTTGFNGIEQDLNIGLTTGAGQTLSVGNSIFGSGAFNISRPIGLQTNASGSTLGSDNIVVQGSGTFTAANTYTRATYSMERLVLSGVNGSLASQDSPGEGAVILRNSRLVLDNSNGTNANRLMDGQTLVMKSAVLEFIGNNEAAASENVGKIQLQSGENALLLGEFRSGIAVTANELVRQEGSQATFVIQAEDINDEPALFLETPISSSELIGAGSVGSNAAAVVPWMVGRATGSTALVPATYDDVELSVRPLRPTEYVLNSLSAANSEDPPPNAVFDSTVTTIEVSDESTVNSLSILSGQTLHVSAPLRINSGSMILGATQDVVSTRTVVSGSGSIELGESTGYLYVSSLYNSDAQATEINVPINALSGLVKSGPGTLIMAVDQPGLNNGITVNRGIIKPLTGGALGNGPLTIAGGINGSGTIGYEAALHIDDTMTLPNPLISKTLGQYATFGVLWYAPIVIANNATVTLTSDLGGDSYFLLQNRFAEEKATLVLANTEPVTPKFISINIFANSEVKLVGKTGLSLEALSPNSIISGNGESLGFFRLYSGQLSVGGVTPGPETLTAQGLSIFGGTVSMEIGGPELSDKLVLTGNESFTNFAQLSDATLDLGLLPDYAPTTGQAITLIELVQPSDAFNGAFIDKGEGQIFTLAGFDAWLTYLGGDGNDLVLNFGDLAAVRGDFGGAESTDGSFNTPDGAFNELDVEGFLLALNDEASYLTLNPTLGDSLVARGDFGGAESTDGSFNTPDGAFNELDVEGFLLALNDPAGYAAIQPPGLGGVSAIPEPASVGVLGLGVAAALGRRRRRV